MNDQEYQTFIKKNPEIARKLKTIGTSLIKNNYETGIPEELSSGTPCQDISNKIIALCNQADLGPRKYVLFKEREIERGNDGEIEKVYPKVLTPKNHLGMGPCGSHFICGVNSFALEPLMKKPIKLEDISMELFGENIPLYKLEKNGNYYPRQLLTELIKIGAFSK